MKGWLALLFCVAALLPTPPPVAAAETDPPFPTYEQVRAAYRPSDARLLDRNGALLHELRIDRGRRRLRWTPIEETSPALIAAVIASEDRRFYSHSGVDWIAVGRAALGRLLGDPGRGASTISMQLAALLDARWRRPGGPRSLAEKVDQMAAARRLEGAWSKAHILEAYLNLTTYRGELQGISAAASVLFEKLPDGLDEAESAVLAALLRAPNAPAADLLRRAHLLAPGAASDIDRRVAAAAGASAGATRGGPRASFAPHAARRLLSRDAPGDLRSTLDLAAQRFASEALRRDLLALSDHNVADGAVLVADNSSGDVLAYVGSSGDLSAAPHVDGIRARRQAGSALKPFLYALAFDLRLLHPASLLDDTPLEIASAGGIYRPSNYDDRFAGMVSARAALAGSLNVPAVRALGLVGGERFARQLRRLGFEGVRESGDFYGPSLALGSADVALWELANAFRALANGGRWSALRMRADEPATAEQSVYSPAAAFLVSDILSDRQSRSATFGLESPLDTRFWSAVKTGTSKDMRDNWCVGYSERYTVGVWVGNFSGEPMRGVSGVTGAAPIWHDVMSWLQRGESSRPPAPPAGVVSERVSFASFAAAGESDRVEWFLDGTAPAEAVPALARVPRITSPADGTIVAIDPDIAPQRQRLHFRARGDAAAAHWRLDGGDLGAIDAVSFWEPVPGRHVLQLLAANQRVIDQVSFQVRGGASARQEEEGDGESARRW